MVIVVVAVLEFMITEFERQQVKVAESMGFVHIL